MNSSDSEDFESADEGVQDENQVKKERKKRISSSNFSDCAQELDSELDWKKPEPVVVEPATKGVETGDGWNEFDACDAELKEAPKVATTANKTSKVQTKVEEDKQEDKGWDDFDACNTELKEAPKVATTANKTSKVQTKVEENKQEDKGWDDFDAFDAKLKEVSKVATTANKTSKVQTKVEENKQEDKGWDDFDAFDAKLKEVPKVATTANKTSKVQTKVEEDKQEDKGWDDFDACNAELKEVPKVATTANKTSKVQTKVEENKQEDKGWDDFDAFDVTLKEAPKVATTANKTSKVQTKVEEDKGWDDFDDWGPDSNTIKNETLKHAQSKAQNVPDNIKPVVDRLAETSISEPKTSSWGWGGWGVDSILSSASAGITTITSHVSQGISTVLETGIGAPDPGELARMNAKEFESRTEPTTANVQPSEARGEGDSRPVTSDGAFQLGSLISGVTKFVETTGTKVIAGGLDTLETIGKKTMEVLQDGDPGLAKKRAMLGLDAGDKPVLSQVLREAKERAEEDDKIKEEKREAKEVHYETLFDDFEGLIHLEALEMLSKQISMRIEERLRNADVEKRQEIRETLQQVAELCEMPDENDDDEDSDASSSEAFHERLQEVTQDLGVKLHFQPLVKQHEETLKWLENNEGLAEKAIYKRAVSGLAECTALCVEIYHKAGEMMLVKTRRSTADEADALTQLTSTLTRHISDMATRFTDKLNSLPVENKDQINTYITNVFLEAGNSSTYIQNAFHLALPILQIGAA